MSELKGAGVIRSVGRPDFRNQLFLFWVRWRQHWTIRPSPAYSAWHTALRAC